MIYALPLYLQLSTTRLNGLNIETVDNLKFHIISSIDTQIEIKYTKLKLAEAERAKQKIFTGTKSKFWAGSSATLFIDECAYI